MAPPEYVIVGKMMYFRDGRSEKHLRDIAAILQAQGDALDTEALTRWLGHEGLNKLWDEAFDGQGLSW